MVSDISRREALSALAAAGVAGVAGCTGDGDGDTTTAATSTDATTTTTTTTESTTESTTETTTQPSVQPAETPVAAVEAAFTAEDAVAFQSRFHPIHPMSLEQMSREDAQALAANTTDPSSVERVDREVTADLVAAAPLPGSDAERSAIEDALAGASTAVVEVTAETEAGTETVQLATVEYDGGWVILAHPLPSDDEAAASTFDAYVVEDVAFDADAGTATVQFVGAVTADSVTVEAVQADSSTSTSTPGSVTSLDVGVDPDGDEVVVSASLDGEYRVVHRERFPVSDRLVDDVEFVVDPETDDRPAIARVNFNDTDEEGTVRVASTVKDSSSEASPAGSLTYLVVGIDPNGDEVVVSYPAEGDTEEVHRERWRP
jgi:hypothetical protein